MYLLLLIISVLAAAGVSGYIVYRRLSPSIVAAKELDYETEKKNELTEQKSFANITEEFIHEQRIKEKLTESTGAYGALNQIYQDISNKLERYYKYIYLLDRSV